MDIASIVTILLVIFAAIGLMLLVGLITRNYIKVPPNQVAVFYGKRHGEHGYVVVTGGARFKWPLIEDVKVMDLAVFQQKLTLNGIPNKDGVKVNIIAVATCKIKTDTASLNAAVERFLGKRPEEIHAVVLENLEGQLRAVLGTMTIEQLIKEREVFANKVKSEATAELDKIGVGIDILNIQNIDDASGYITALGAARVSEVKRDATIGTANADRDAKLQSTTAQKDGNVRAAENDALTASAAKDRDVKIATYSAEVAAEQATAAQAGPLASAKAKQAVVIQEVAVEEQRQKAQIGVQEQIIAVATKAQEASIVVPAKKTAEAAVATAEGHKKQQVITSEGAKEAAINAAEAVKQTKTLEGAGEASRIEAIGKAEGAAIEAKLLAEAKGKQALMLAEAAGSKALNDALAEMSDGAILQMTLNKLPSIMAILPAIVKEAAAPLSAIGKVVVIDAGGNGTGSGMQKFAGQVPATLLSLLSMAKEMGLDPTAMLQKIGVKATDIIEGAQTSGKQG